MPRVIGIQDGEEGSSQQLKKQNEIFIRTRQYNVTYLVLSDYVGQGSDQILTAVGIPDLFSTYNGTYCNSLNPKQSSTVYDPYNPGTLVDLWEVSVGYDSEIDPKDSKQDPDKKDPVTRWTGDIETERLFKDAQTGRAIKTGAGESVLVDHPVCSPIFEVERYERYPINPMIFFTFVNHVNSRPYMGAPRGCALLLPIESSKEVIGGIAWARTKYRIKFKLRFNAANVMQPDGWKAEVLHEGFWFRRAPGGEPEIFLGKSGDPKKVNLKADGTLLPITDPEQFIKFNRYPKVDLSLLNLPTR